MLFTSRFHAELIDMADVMFNSDEDKMCAFIEQFLVEESPVDEMCCIKIWSDNGSAYDADDMTARAQIGRWLAEHLPALNFAYIDLERIYG